mgnify:CR=1 FL=1
MSFWRNRLGQLVSCLDCMWTRNVYTLFRSKISLCKQTASTPTAINRYMYIVVSLLTTHQSYSHNHPCYSLIFSSWPRPIQRNVSSSSVSSSSVSLSPPTTIIIISINKETTICMVTFSFPERSVCYGGRSSSIFRSDSLRPRLHALPGSGSPWHLSTEHPSLQQ